MASETEPAKLLLPYLQRADELQKHEPLVAYYCRLYAMEKGLRIPQKERTKTTNALLVSLINQLEKDKKSIKLGPEDNLYVEGFASSVFAKADKQDRAGRADLNTAKTFYAASIFFEILNQFNERQPDIEQRQKYAVWKAAEIRKALKEGRRPEPGPPGDDNDLPDPPTSTAYDMGPSENNPASQPGVARPPGEDTTSRHHIKDLGRNESFPASYSGGDIPSPHADNASPHGFPPGQLPPSSYSGADYHSSGADYHSASFQQPPTPSRPHVPSNPPPDPQQYSSDHQQYSSDQHSLPQGFHPPENQIPPYTYPNFQTYPSFNDSTLPVAPSHQPYYTGPDMGYSHQSAPPAPDYPLTKHYDSPSRNQSAPPAPDYSSTKHYESQSRNGNQVATPAPSAVAYASDPNYLPPVEKITEAHKAARFAVGALAFDDVPVAVEFLRRSLELLTNPAAESH